MPLYAITAQAGGRDGPAKFHPVRRWKWGRSCPTSQAPEQPLRIANPIVIAAPLFCDAQRRFEMANVADRIVETLEAANVRRIYGLVGDSLNGITESLGLRGKIEWIAVRHEEVAAFAAGAQAQLTGELAVCAGSCGPGNLHLINGLFDCHRNRVPVVAIAAHIPSTEIGSSYFQETHPQSLFKDCCHYVELIST